MKSILIVAIAAVAIWPIYGQSNENVSAQKTVKESCCASISVKPKRERAANYTLFNETLEFTIHFKNEGGQMIQNVVIRDTIDENLDITSLRPLMSNFPFSTLINVPKHYVQFTFENVDLPSSSINDSLSQGYIKFTIESRDDLPEETKVYSKAYVYYDATPVFCTNTTLSTLVSQLPPITTSTKTRLLSGVRIAPKQNPFFNELIMELSLEQPRHFTLSIFNLNGQQLYSKNLNLGAGNHLLPIPESFLQNSETYVYRLQAEEGFIAGKVIKLSD